MSFVISDTMYFSEQRKELHSSYFLRCVGSIIIFTGNRNEAQKFESKLEAEKQLAYINTLSNKKHTRSAIIDLEKPIDENVIAVEAEEVFDDEQPPGTINVKLGFNVKSVGK